MDFLFQIIIWLACLTIVLFVVSLFLSRKKKSKIKDKIQKIDSESKLLAIDELRKIIKKNPDNYLAREKLADLLIENKSYLLAIKEYLIILDHSQNNDQIDEVRFLNKVGKTYLSLQNFEEAKKYFLIAKSRDELNYDATLGLSQIEMLNHNYDKAEQYCSLITKMVPENMEVLRNHGIALFHLGKFLNAVKKFEFYLNKNSDDLEILHMTGHCYYNLNRFDEAIKCFNKLKKIKEYASDSFYHLGNIHKEKELYVQAVEDYNNALVSGEIKEIHKLSEINYNLAESYIKAHDIQRALQHWKKVADMDPYYKDVQTKLENYAHVTANSLLETYLIGSVNQFTKICQLFVKYYVAHSSVLKGNVNFLDIQLSPDSSLEIMAEVTSGNFIESYFFVFMRSTTSIGDMALRNLYNTLKDKKADKGICITAGTFTDSAKEFVESRMLKIVERERLIEVLSKISQNLKAKKKS